MSAATTTCPRPQCDGVLVAAYRYGPTPERLPVTACFDCGWETPRLSCCTRVKPADGWMTCPCGKRWYVVLSRRLDGRGKHCSVPCRWKFKRTEVAA